MTDAEFEAFVRRLEPFARERPRAYAFRVAGLAILGYLYLFAVLALLIGAVALIFGMFVYGRVKFGPLLWKIGIPLAVLSWIVLKSLWVRIHPPEGILLSPETARPLFDASEEIRSAVGGPRVHRVLLTDEYNASVTQIPRLGIFGWPRNYLMVGLPLLQSMSPEEFRAVLAHEFGHLAGAHSRFSVWIYRIRTVWFQLMTALQQEAAAGASIFTRFFRWYAPYFGAYSFVLARRHEYDADRCSAAAAGSRVAADALVRINVGGARLEEGFWIELGKRAGREPEPPSAPFAEMARFLAAAEPAGRAAFWIDRALRRKTDVADTHPSLADRLAALGEAAREPAPLGETAAARFLGPALATLTGELDRRWNQAAVTAWRQRFEAARESRKKLEALQEKAKTGPLTMEDEFERAGAAEAAGEETLALEFYRGLAIAHPDHAGALFAVGRLLLNAKDPEGIRTVEEAMQLDPAAILPGCEIIHGFLVEEGRTGEAKPWLERGRARAELLERAKAERETITKQDTLIPHGAPASAVETLRRELARYPAVASAWLAGKKVAHLPESPFYVLGIAATWSWRCRRFFRLAKGVSLAQMLAQELTFPGETFVIVLGDDTAYLKKLLRKLEGAQVYRR